MAAFSIANDNMNETPEQNLFLYSNSNTATTNLTDHPWQQQQQQQQQQRPLMAELPSMNNNYTSGSMSCQDCGNQAKKDCSYTRCRTCCKSRGFQCATHVKSTWVPAAKRRERKLLNAARMNAATSESGTAALSSFVRPMEQVGDVTKRSRDVLGREPMRVAMAPASAGMAQSWNLPTEVSSAAVFRCVRVSQLDNGDDEYAYRTALNIGGRLFKGILYDQGLEVDYQQMQTDQSSSNSASASARTNRMLTTSNPSTVLLESSTVYPFSTYMSGTHFFPYYQHSRP